MLQLGNLHLLGPQVFGCFRLCWQGYNSVTCTRWAGACHAKHAAGCGNCL